MAFARERSRLVYIKCIIYIIDSIYIKCIIYIIVYIKCSMYHIYMYNLCNMYDVYNMYIMNMIYIICVIYIISAGSRCCSRACWRRWLKIT